MFENLHSLHLDSEISIIDVLNKISYDDRFIEFGKCVAFVQSKYSHFKYTNYN